MGDNLHGDIQQHETMDYKQRRRTLTVLDVVQNDNAEASSKDIDRAVLLLDHEIANALVGLAQLIEMKYEQCVPDICASNSLLEKIHRENESIKSVSKSVFGSLSAIQDSISEEDRAVVARSHLLKECISKISILEEIEGDLSALWYSEKEAMPLHYAQLVAAVEEKFSLLSKNKADVNETFTERICPALRQEIVVLREGIHHFLNEYWNKIFVFTDQLGQFTMKILSEGKQQLEEHFEAMRVVQIFDGKMANLSKTLLDNFFSPVIRHCNAELSHTQAVGLRRPVSEYHIKVPNAKGAGKETCDTVQVFQLLTSFFENLFNDLGDVKVDNILFVRHLYEKVSKEFMSVLLHDCIAKSISSHIDNETSVLLTETFFNFLTEKGFIQDGHLGYVEFAKDVSAVLNNRYCTKILVDARSLVSSPYMQLLTVGYDLVDERETMEEIKAECSLVKNQAMNRESFPRLLRFARCQISKSTAEFIDLVKSTILKAAEADSTDIGEILIKTARNAVQLFICIAPRHHHTQIVSAPQMAAVFYNNCYYICHCLMTMPVDISEGARKVLLEKSLAVTFVDLLPALRQLAADALENHLAQCRRQIATLLANNQVFVGLDDLQQLTKCEETLDGCILYLNQIANVWRGVFSNTVFAEALGNLVAFLFNSIVCIIFATDNIRPFDAETSAKLVVKIILAMEELFVFGEARYSSIHRFAEKEYFRIKEVVFCLNASLQDILDRWCSGKGLLAQCIQSKELRQLIKALFPASGKREYILKMIG